MPRRNWRYVAVAIGLLLLGLFGYTSYQLYQSGEQQRAQYSYQPARQTGRRVIAPTKTIPKGYQPNCENPDGNSNADLCAQWAAVDQVMESNRLASVNVRLALFISILTLIGTGFVGWTFLETRTTARRELRAYLFVEAIGLGIANGGPAKGQPGIVIRIKNFGQTPAYRVLHYATVEITNSENPVLAPMPEKMEDISASAIPTGGVITAIRGVGHKVDRSGASRIRKGSDVVVARGRIEYRDTFGRPRWTTYHNYYHGIWPPSDDAVMTFANHGNESDQDNRANDKRRWFQF
jgi:hypothetical protein